MTAYTWPFPAGTPISQPFGSNPSNGFNPVGGHTGTDFAVPVGTPVRAIAAGTVCGVGQLPEPYTSNPWWIEGVWAGNVVVIDHGPVVSVYAHLSEWHVSLGDTVAQGQVIALSGATGGASTGPHCHFETLPDGWDFNNGTYGRVEPATFCTAYWDGATTTPTQEDPLAVLTDEDKTNLFNALARIDAFCTNPPAAFVEAVAKRIFTRPVPYFDPATGKDTGKGTTLATLVGYNDLQHSATRSTVPPAVLNQVVPMLDQISSHTAGPVTVTSAADPQAVANAVAAEIKAQWNK